MIYGEFKTKLKEKICAAFPLDEYSVVIREVCKNNNTTKQGIFIKRNGSDATPIFYFDELWDAFQSGTSIEGLIDFIREYLQAAVLLHLRPWLLRLSNQYNLFRLR